MRLRHLTRRRWLLGAAVALVVLAAPAAVAATHMFTGSIAAGDPAQAGRLERDGIPSTCADEGPVPAIFTTTGSRRYDLYRLQNAGVSAQCVTATLDAGTCVGNNFLFGVTYSPSFAPANLQQNWLADSGNSPNTSETWSFDVNTGSAFDVVVHEVTPGAGCGSYTLQVAGTDVVKSETIVNNGSLAAGDPTQTGRLVRDGIPSTCPDEGSFPGIFETTGARRYDVYRFQNPTAIAQCMTAKIDAPNCLGSNFIFGVTYSPSFTPANLQQNWLADSGNSPNPTETWSFDVNAGATFDIVVHELNPNIGCTAYALTVSGFGLARGTPTGLALLGVSAARTPAGPVVRWQTASERDTLGFNVFREQRGERVRANGRLIPAATSAGLHIHSWVDRKAPRGALRYWLQEVRRDGKRVWHGPAAVAPAS